MATIGIDLGTTNTVAAVDSKVVNISDDESPILPSVVAYPPRGDYLVGNAAKSRKGLDAKNTIFSSKRIIGRSWFSADTKEYKKRYPFELIDHERAPHYLTRAGLLSPAEIASRILEVVARHEDIAPLIGSSKTVIAVPSLFGMSERDATKQAALLAGFNDVSLIDEPSATACANLLNVEKSVEHAVVYDLGGGTFDLAVLDCSTQPPRVLSSGGDLYLGGDDVDIQLAEWVAGEVLRNHHWDLKDDPETFARLVIESERAKIKLSRYSDVSIDLSRVDPAAPSSVNEQAIDEDVIDHLLDDLVGRTFVLCDEVLYKAGLSVNEIDRIFVAGGSSLAPQIRNGVEKYFSKNVDYPFDPLHIVSIGASLSPRMGTT